MKKVIFLTLILKLLIISPTISLEKEKDPVLLKINGREITISDFEYVYTKNNLNPQVMDPKSIEEYLELFINFNLKVYEALQLGLDTQASFITELAGYRSQLAQPYLTDQDVTNQLLDEAYERMQFDIRASHILFNLDKHATPADTLAIWNKVINVRERILKGENFGDLAKEFSEDPSAKGMPATPNRPAMSGNAGDLGYFSVLDMVYPFESAAYSLEVGEISMPVRTNFGYHIIKLTDRLPAMGRARVAHIMVNLPHDSDLEQQKQAEAKIKEIHQNLTQGDESFESLAERFSDDKASGRRGGELPAFTSNRMVPEFIKAIAGLNEENNISQPVKTQYGLHIIKFFERQKPTKDDAMVELKAKIARDSRAHLSKQVVLDRLKMEYEFKEHKNNLEVFFTEVDNSIFEGKWEKQRIGSGNEVLFSFAQKSFTQADFANYLEQKQSMRSPESTRNFVSSMYDEFLQETILGYEEDNLSDKYPDFKRIMNEYHDGILLFELTDQKVWGKAMADTSGLRQFFQANVADYMWDDRFDAIIYTFNDEKTAKQGRKLIRKSQRRNVAHEEIMASLNKDSQLAVSADKGMFEVPEKPLLNNISKRKGVSRVINNNNNYVVIWVNKFLPSQPKKLSEIRGLVIADYQNYLEENWVKELRSKYKFEVYRDALKHLTTNR